MLRIVLLVVAAIFIVLVAAAVVRTLVWLALVALIVGVACLVLGGVRARRRSARRATRRN